MVNRIRVPLAMLTALIAVLMLGVVPSAAQTPASNAAPKAPAKAAWTPPRTPEGKPDFQGNWNFATVTPFERPAELAGKATLTDAEAAAFEKETLERNDADRRDRPKEADVALAYNQFWYDRGTKVLGTRQTSLVVDPADGRIPALTRDAQARAGARADQRQQHPADGPEDRSLGERCLLFGAGPPMAPGPYNNNVQFVETRDYVVVMNEMIHDARVIPLNGSPHLPPTVRHWQGDSRGRWEGDTLVVDTTNFTGKTAFRGSSEKLHLVERFTLVSADTLLYEFTVDDPASFAKPWTVSLPLSKTDDAIYEYACHEGNYGMKGMLAGARNKEKAAPGAR